MHSRGGRQPQGGLVQLCRCRKGRHSPGRSTIGFPGLLSMRPRLKHLPRVCTPACVARLHLSCDHRGVLTFGRPPFQDHSRQVDRSVLCTMQLATRAILPSRSTRPRCFHPSNSPSCLRAQSPTRSYRKWHRFTSSRIATLICFLRIISAMEPFLRVDACSAAFLPRATVPIPCIICPTSRECTNVKLLPSRQRSSQASLKLTFRPQFSNMRLLLTHAAKSTQGSSVIFVGSTLSEKAVANRASYVTTKHAVVGLMRSYVQDLFGSGVHTAVVCPGFTDTPMLQAAMASDPEGSAKFIQGFVSCGRLIQVGHYCSSETSKPCTCVVELVFTLGHILPGQQHAVPSTSACIVHALDDRLSNYYFSRHIRLKADGNCVARLFCRRKSLDEWFHTAREWRAEGDVKEQRKHSLFSSWHAGRIFQPPRRPFTPSVLAR